MGNSWTKKYYNGLNLRLEKSGRTLDCQEQYSRKKFLLVHGIDEKTKETSMRLLLTL